MVAAGAQHFYSTKLMCDQNTGSWRELYVYFLNIDIRLTYLKISTHIATIYLEGNLSQNFDIVFSLHFMLCKRMGFEKKCKNDRSYPFLS